MKTKRQPTPAFVFLNGANGHLQSAFFDNESLADFKLLCEDGHELTLMEVCQWIDTASEYFEKRESARHEQFQN